MLYYYIISGKLQVSSGKFRNAGALIVKNAKCEMKLPVVRGQVSVEERFALIVDQVAS